jgi:hypothetical protein
MLTLMALLLAALLGPGSIHVDFNGGGPPGAPVATDVGGGGPAGIVPTSGDVGGGGPAGIVSPAYGDVLTPPAPVDDVGGGGPAGH